MQRIDALESLRGLMALWVVVGHVLLTVGLETSLVGPLQLITQNGLAVDVFIILSGFVIFSLLDSDYRGYGSYLIRRFMRLYPVYLLCMIVAILMLDFSIDALQNYPWQGHRNEQRLLIFEGTKANFSQHLLAHATLLHGIVPHHVLPYSDYAFVGQAWSISLEWQFYLVAPAFFFALRKGSRWRMIVTLLVVIVAHYALRWKGGYGFLPARAPYFLLGTASYFYWKHQKEYSSLPDAILPFVMPTATTIALLLCSIPVAIWTAVLLSLTASERTPRICTIESVISKALQFGPLLWLGRVSYSIYLLHMFPLFIGMNLATDLGFNRLNHALFLLVFVTATTLAMAQVTYRLVERPGMRLGAYWATRLSSRRLLS